MEFTLEGPRKTILAIETRFIGYLLDGKVCFFEQEERFLQTPNDDVLVHRGIEELSEAPLEFIGI